MSGYGVAIELNGKTRQLRYDLNALAEIEERLGIPLAELANVTVSIKTIRTLLWAGLIHEDAELKETDVGAWIGPGGMSMTDAMEKVGKALAEAFGGENPTIPEPTTPVTGTGEAQGSSVSAN